MSGAFCFRNSPSSHTCHITKCHPPRILASIYIPQHSSVVMQDSEQHHCYDSVFCLQCRWCKNEQCQKQGRMKPVIHYSYVTTEQRTEQHYRGRQHTRPMQMARAMYNNPGGKAQQPPPAWSGNGDVNRMRRGIRVAALTNAIRLTQYFSNKQHIKSYKILSSILDAKNVPCHPCKP